MTVTMHKVYRHKFLSISTVAFAFALLCLVFGAPAFALPTVSHGTGSPSSNYSHNDYSYGPSLSSGSSWSESYDENAHEDWHSGDEYDGDCDDGYGDNGNNGYGDDCENDNDGDDDGNASPVPEPASALLMSLGLAGAAYLKRRRK